jgi:hypothetical protein
MQAELCSLHFQSAAALAAHTITNCSTFKPLRWTWKADLLLHDSIQAIADAWQPEEQPEMNGTRAVLPVHVLRISSHLRHDPSIVYAMSVARATTANRIDCEQALSLLLQFGRSGSTECAAAVVGVDMIAKLGQGGTALVQAKVAKVLHGLAVEQGGSESAFRGAAPVLSRLLGSGFKDVRAHAAAVCSELVAREAFVTALVNGGLITPLVSLLAYASADSDADAVVLDAMVHATHAIRMLCLDAPARVEVVRAHGLVHLSTMLQWKWEKERTGEDRHQGTTRNVALMQCRRNAAEACLNVTAAEGFEQASVAPLVKPIVSLLALGDGVERDWITWRHAAGAIENLTQVEGLDRLVLDAGGIERLVAIILNPTESEAVDSTTATLAWEARIEAEANEVEILLSRQAAACALQNLSAVFEYSLCGTAGALEALVTLLGQNDLKCSRAAASTFANLSLEERLRQHIVDAGAVQALVALLGEESDLEVKQHAAAALWDLSAADDRLGEQSIVQVRETIVQAGAIEAVTKLLSDEDTIDQLLSDEDRESLAEPLLGILWNLCLCNNTASFDALQYSGAFGALAQTVEQEILALPPTSSVAPAASPLDVAAARVVKILPTHQRLMKPALPALCRAFRSGKEDLVEVSAAAMICVVFENRANLQGLCACLAVESAAAGVSQSNCVQSALREMMVLQQRTRAQPLTIASLMTDELKCRKEELLDFYERMFTDRSQKCSKVLQQYPFDAVVSSLRKRYGAVPDGWETFESKSAVAANAWKAATSADATPSPPRIEHAVAVAGLQSFYEVQKHARAVRVEEDLVEKKFEDLVASLQTTFNALPPGWESWQRPKSMFSSLSLDLSDLPGFKR